MNALALLEEIKTNAKLYAFLKFQFMYSHSQYIKKVKKILKRNLEQRCLALMLIQTLEIVLIIEILMLVA